MVIFTKMIESLPHNFGLRPRCGVWKFPTVISTNNPSDVTYFLKWYNVIVIIGITGKAFSGKDTLTDFLLERFESLGVKAIKVPLAKPLKEDYCQIKGITFEELEKDKENHRPFLQFYGDVRKFIYGNNLYFVDRLMETIEHYRKRNTYQFFIVSDVRYDFEARRADHMVEVIRKNGKTTIHSEHSSERGIPKEFVNTTICNDSTLESLKDKAYSLAETLYEKELLINPRLKQQI